MRSLEEVLTQIDVVNSIFKDYILESNYVRVNDTITWPNFERGFSKSLYMREYEELIRRRQFSLLLTDKSFIQFYFEFENNNIKTVKYSYYPYPIGLKEDVSDIENYFDESKENLLVQFYYDLAKLMTEEVGISLDDQQRQETIQFFKERYNYQLNVDDVREIIFDKIYGLTNYSHIRMDFDPDVETHHKCEFQFGAIKHLRLPLEKILPPFIFTDFIFRYFFKSIYPSLVAKRNYKRTFIQERASSMEIPDFLEHSFYNTI